MNECLQVWWDLCLKSFTFSLCFFTVYLLLFLQQDPSLSTPEQASLCEYVVATEFSLKYRCCSFISTADAFFYSHILSYNFSCNFIFDVRHLKKKYEATVGSIG